MTDDDGMLTTNLALLWISDMYPETDIQYPFVSVCKGTTSFSVNSHFLGTKNERAVLFHLFLFPATAQLSVCVFHSDF